MESNKAEEYFYGFQNHFMDFGLDNLKKFMRELGDPQEKIRIIHIAGTNGKGSCQTGGENETCDRTGGRTEPASDSF